MFNIKRCNPGMGALLVASFALVGCAPRTNVSTTANVPAQYSHAFMSVQEIWLNTSATATPDDTTWAKYPLQTPVTVDLASSMEGQLTALTTGLNVPIGTYAQLRLIPVDPSATVLASATALGAQYNSEVDYTDTAGNAQRLRLELLNPDRGIGIPTSIQVTGTGYNILSSSPTSTTSSSTSSSTSSTSTTAKPFSIAINVDGARDLLPFAYAATDTLGTNAVSGFLLNPHMTAYDGSQVGAIQGTVNVAGLDATTITTQSASGFYDIQVTAESLSTDGTRHVAVNSAPVRSDGTFTLYPLSSSSTTPTSYDLVIHGPAIATVIIKGVTVNVGDPATTTPVNVGTITARAASSFQVTLDTTNPLPAGASVGFYQTLPGATEVPYVVELKAVDPFTRAFPTNWPVKVSSASIDYGTFSSSGSTIALATSDPTEGASTYRLAATAPLFTDGPLTSTTTTTLTGTTTTAVTVPLVNKANSATAALVPTLIPASGTTAFATFNVSQTNTFTNGSLIVSHDGGIVATASLDAALARSGTSTLTVTGIPAGSGLLGTTTSGLYYVSVRVWKSSDPANTVVREIYSTALDLRSATSAVYNLTIN